MNILGNIVGFLVKLAVGCLVVGILIGMWLTSQAHPEGSVGTVKDKAGIVQTTDRR